MVVRQVWPSIAAWILPGSWTAGENKGVKPNRMVAAGFGEFQPIDTGTTEDAYRHNRRIEFTPNANSSEGSAANCGRPRDAMSISTP